MVADIALEDCVLLLPISLSGSAPILIARSWAFRPSTIKLRYRVCRHHNDIDASQRSTESEFSPCSIDTVSWSGYGNKKKESKKREQKEKKSLTMVFNLLSERRRQTSCLPGLTLIGRIPCICHCHDLVTSTSLLSTSADTVHLLARNSETFLFLLACKSCLCFPLPLQAMWNMEVP